MLDKSTLQLGMLIIGAVLIALIVAPSVAHIEDVHVNIGSVGCEFTPHVHPNR